MTKRTGKKEEENQFHVAQQHLANERTYLAWVRTAIAIIGIRFLTMTFHLTIGKSHQGSHVLAILISILSCLFGISIIVGGAVQFLQKRKQIEVRDFYLSYPFVLFVSILLILLIILTASYIILQFIVK